ncbi:hypothetical protein GW17_00038154 [Ensete ventricosum]|nr:hypothetical protein GW17_00038154 [Ensete ventricosum]
MACRGLWECLLKLFNFLLTVTGLAMVGYGVYLLVEWNRVSSSDDDDEPISPTGDTPEFLKFGRPMLVAVSLSSSFLDKLPKAWGRYHVSHMMLNHQGHDAEVSATWRVGADYVALGCQPRGIRVSSVGHIIVSLSFVPILHRQV